MRMLIARRKDQNGWQPRVAVASLALATRIVKVSILCAVLLLIVAEIGLGQSAKPDFTGMWRSTGISRGPVVKSMIEIKQTESTFSIRHILEKGTATDWHIYPTDGKVIKTRGRNHVENRGHWDANILILESTGPGNAPWRRSTERQVIRLSNDGRIMTIKFHELADKDSVHDYAVEAERVR